ncbi:hypothetical protein B0H14DRAFT_3029557 [Mycena olivaceomarginata]|nr:hypothetical protein B0H14DRAFT_3029557 [Mycena olivaceomarginata]
MVMISRIYIHRCMPGYISLVPYILCRVLYIISLVSLDYTSLYNSIRSPPSSTVSFFGFCPCMECTFVTCVYRRVHVLSA